MPTRRKLIDVLCRRFPGPVCECGGGGIGRANGQEYRVGTLRFAHPTNGQAKSARVTDPRLTGDTCSPAAAGTPLARRGPKTCEEFPDRVELGRRRSIMEWAELSKRPSRKTPTSKEPSDEHHHHRF